jgi:signal transduction histidine kinase
MTSDQLMLTVTDDGCGIDRNGEGKVPPSLRRRARWLGARVSATTPEGGGTSIQLRQPVRRGHLMKDNLA